MPGRLQSAVPPISEEPAAVGKETATSKATTKVSASEVSTSADEDASKESAVETSNDATTEKASGAAAATPVTQQETTRKIVVDADVEIGPGNAAYPRLESTGVLIVPGPETGTAYIRPHFVRAGCPSEIAPCGEPRGTGCPTGDNTVIINQVEIAPPIPVAVPWRANYRHRPALFPRGYYVHGLHGPFFRPWGVGYPGAYDSLPPYFGR